MDALDVKSWEDCSPTGCILVGKSWNGRRDIQVIFDSPEASQDFERRWVLTVMRLYASHAESEEIVKESLILNENTGEMLTMSEAMMLIESGCSQAGDRDGMQAEQAENTEM
ncbi:hypothetical protein TRAPUB_3681 [Trametes pubescens]|uniref:Uncharacterized protein n=1 Tax=Trametes pubescens TaxID=154538 RepID=A0A1M2VD93_TRAPU|nr:hypothetical protein TRAPUB_3681 [Trametes pubescens]